MKKLRCSDFQGAPGNRGFPGADGLPGPKVHCNLSNIGILLAYGLQCRHLFCDISMSKGCSRRSWNIWSIRTKRFLGRPWSYRRTWFTRCKGNTEITVLLFIYQLFICVAKLYPLTCLSCYQRVSLVPLGSREQRASLAHW